MLNRKSSTQLNNILFPTQLVGLDSLMNIQNSTKFSQAVLGVIDGTPKILGIHGGQYALNDNTKFIGGIISKVDSLGIGYNTQTYNYNNSKFNVRIVLDGIKFSLTNNKGVTKDNLSPMLDITNSYDGSSSPSFSMSTYRQICSNGMIGLQRVASLTKKSTKQINYCFDSIPQMIDEFVLSFGEQVVIADKLASKQIFDVKARISEIATALDLFKAETSSKGVITGYSDTVETIHNVILTEAKELGTSPNEWLLYNGLNEWLFSLDNSITDTNRNKIDVEIVNRLLAEV